MKKLKSLFFAIVPVLLITVTACGDNETPSANTEPPIIVDQRCSDNESVGYDTVNNMWEIYNENGLKAFRDEVNNGDYDLNAMLVCDITLTNKADNVSWIPVLTDNVFYANTSAYIGTFDGNNKIISDLYIDNDTLDFQGLFGFVGVGGVVKNLHVDNVSISANDLIGAIVANNEGSIYASTAKNITLEADGGGAIIGGIASQIYNSGKIIATYIDNATLRTTATGGGEASIGGIVGNIGTRGSPSTIRASYTHDVTIESNNRHAGGIAGASPITRIFDANFFVNDNTSLSGIGNFNTSGGDNVSATPLANVAQLNDNVSVMNTAIDGFEVEDNVTIDSRYEAGNPLPVLMPNN